MGATNDPGTIAQNLISYIGGASGGMMLVAALMVAALLAAIGMIGRHHILHVFIIGCFVWVAAFMFRQFVGFA